MLKGVNVQWCIKVDLAPPFPKVDLDIQAHSVAGRLLAPPTALRHVAVALHILQIAYADGAAVILTLLLLLLLLRRFLNIDRLRLKSR